MRDYYILGGIKKMDLQKTYSVGKRLGTWRDEMAQTVTFIVTEDCNLRCEYCYISHKEVGKVMSLKVACDFIDFLLNMKTVKSPAVILEFIGGEPLLEVDLIDKICDYFKKEAYRKQDKWYWNYRISICTNGVNYSDENVQRFILKNIGKLSVSITIDGVKEKHDMHRVFPNGKGSYDIIKKNIPLWLNQFPGSTKVTFSSEDLQYLKESIIQLWNDGIEEVAANVVFENVWKENDDKIYEAQLKELADYIIENCLSNSYKCTLFDDTIGQPYTKEELKNTSCGTGKMLAVNYEGNIYPCIRYYDYSLSNKEGYIIGNIKDGIDQNKLRVFGTLMNKYQSDDECINCEVASGCMFCQGFGYDDADTPTNFQRAKYICKMHKARVRANNYYFAKLKNLKGIMRDHSFSVKKTMFFLLGDDYTSFCSYKNDVPGRKMMDENVIVEGLKFAEENFFKPIFVHSKTENKFDYIDKYNEYDILHIITAEKYSLLKDGSDCLVVYDKGSINEEIKDLSNIIFLIGQDDIELLSECIGQLVKRYERINIKITGLDVKFPYEIYEEELRKIKKQLVEKLKNTGELVEVNILTDILFLNQHESCGAGDNTIAYAPNGNIYICPAYYSNDLDLIGDAQNGTEIKNKHLYSLKYAPLCNCCDAYHCEKCTFINKKETLEVNVSPDFQCKKTHVERKIAFELQEELKYFYEFTNALAEVSYTDPYENLDAINKNLGIYKVD